MPALIYCSFANWQHNYLFLCRYRPVVSAVGIVTVLKAIRGMLFRTKGVQKDSPVSLGLVNKLGFVFGFSEDKAGKEVKCNKSEQA